MELLNTTKGWEITLGSWKPAEATTWGVTTETICEVNVGDASDNGKDVVGVECAVEGMLWPGQEANDATKALDRVIRLLGVEAS